MTTAPTHTFLDRPVTIVVRGSVVSTVQPVDGGLALTVPTVSLVEVDRDNETCDHGLSAWLCAGPGHYPMDGDDRGPSMYFATENNDYVNDYDYPEEITMTDVSGETFVVEVDVLVAS